MATKMASEGQDWVLAGKCTEFFPRGKVPADRAQHFIEHPEQLTALILNALIGVVGSLWNQLFGHLKVWDQNFNEAHYPLEPETEEVVEEYGFDETIVGTEAKRRLKEMGYSLPGPRACGKYILVHPRAQFEHPLVGLGAEWQYQNDVFVPVFVCGDSEPGVGLLWQGRRFASNGRFLVSRKPAQK